MKYETPEMTVLTPAINAVQGGGGGKGYPFLNLDGLVDNEQIAGYSDWES